VQGAPLQRPLGERQAPVDIGVGGLLQKLCVGRGDGSGQHLAWKEACCGTAWPRFSLSARGVGRRWRLGNGELTSGACASVSEREGAAGWAK
jgi:hypothetical protein